MDRERGREQDAASGEETIDQGPSYSSSYNESTPGEVAETRQESLETEEPHDDAAPGQLEG